MAEHGKKYFLANYDWNEETGVGDFTYVDRETGESIQEQYEQRKYWLTLGQRALIEKERAAEAEKERQRQERFMVRQQKRSIPPIMVGGSK